MNRREYQGESFVELNEAIDESLHDELVVAPAEGAQTSPPERVRFCSAAQIYLEGEEKPLEGAVLNLSEGGLACTLPAELAKDEPVVVAFRLSLAEEPISVQCNVLWRQLRPKEDPIYGMSFGQMEGKLAERIVAAVSERSEGRAAEWGLPLLPERPVSASAPRGTNPWVSAAAGLVAGIGLALALSAIPKNAVSAPQSENIVVATELAVTPTTTANPTTALEPVSLETPTVAQVEPPAPVVSPVAEPPVVAVAEKAVTPTKATPAPSAKPRATTTVPSRTVGKKAVELTLLTDGPVDEHVGFWLQNPKRYVVDIAGRKSGFSAKELTVASAAIGKVRVGNHPGKVRFVIETSEDMAPKTVTHVKGNALLVELARN